MGAGQGGGSGRSSRPSILKGLESGVGTPGEVRSGFGGARSKSSHPLLFVSVDQVEQLGNGVGSVGIGRRLEKVRRGRRETGAAGLRLDVGCLATSCSVSTAGWAGHSAREKRDAE